MLVLLLSMLAVSVNPSELDNIRWTGRVYAPTRTDFSILLLWSLLWSIAAKFIFLEIYVGVFET